VQSQSIVSTPPAAAGVAINRGTDRDHAPRPSLPASQPVPLRLSTDPLHLALFVLVIFTVSRVHQHFPLLAKTRPALLLALGAAGLAYINPRYLSRKRLLYTWPAKVVAILTILTAGSALFGISVGNSGKFILDEYSKTIIQTLLLIAAIRHAGDLYTIVWAYVIGSGILVYFAQFVFGTSSHGSYSERLGHLYTYDANDIGVVLLVGLALCLLVLQSARPRVRPLLMLLLVGIGAALARSGSRGAFLGIGAFVIAMLLLPSAASAMKRLGFVVVVGGGLMIFAPEGYWRQMATVLAPSQDYNTYSKDGREALIKRGLGYMARYPAFGIGINNFSKAECTISEKAEQRLTEGGVRCTAPHNSYVQAGAETGILGLIAWCSLIIGGIVALLRLRGRLPRAWRRGDPEQRFLYAATTYLVLAFIGFAVTAFFVSFAWMDTLYLLAALVAGLYVSVYDRYRREGVPSAPQPRLTRLTGATMPWQRR
jgi:O-antigen ligase